MAVTVIADIVKRVRKDHPDWTEAKTCAWVLDNDEHARATYSRGEIVERESRRPRGATT